jgi:hypothetical protein
MNFSYTKGFFNKSFYKQNFNTKNYFKIFNSKSNSEKFLINCSNKQFHSTINFFATSSFLQNNIISLIKSGSHVLTSQKEYKSTDDLTTQISGNGKNYL